MKTIKMDANSKFAFAEENTNYGIAFVLTEDGMKGTSSSWAQSNYYSGRSGYPSYMDWWCSQGSKVTGLEYNFVAVGAWQIASGFNGSVKTSFEAGEVMPFSYTADISTKTLIQDKSKLKVAALLIDQSTGSIVNATQVAIKDYDPTAIYSIGAATSTEAARYALDGRQISAPQHGINIVKMSDGSVRKVMVK